jgi:hypothetical protein
MAMSQPAKQSLANATKVAEVFLGPARRMQLMIAAAFCLAVTGWMGLNDWRSYRTAGSHQVDMTMEDVRQAGALTPFAERWVRLVEPVSFDCSHGLQWTENGDVTEIVLAFDSSKQQPLWLEYKGAYTCDTLNNILLEGMLMQPDKFWVNKGMFAPSARYPLLELQVGRSPADRRKRALAMGFVSLVSVLFFVLVYLARSKKKSANLLSPNVKIGP